MLDSFSSKNEFWKKNEGWEKLGYLMSDDDVYNGCKDFGKVSKDGHCWCHRRSLPRCYFFFAMYRAAASQSFLLLEFKSNVCTRCQRRRKHHYRPIIRCRCSAPYTKGSFPIGNS